MAQVVGDLTTVSLLADADIARLGKDFCGIGEDGTVKALVHNLLIFDVVEGKDPEHHQTDDQERSHSGTQNGTLQASTEALHARDFYFNSQASKLRRIAI